MRTLENWRAVEDGWWGGALCGWARGLDRGPFAALHFLEQRLSGLRGLGWPSGQHTGAAELQMGQSLHSARQCSALAGCSQTTDGHLDMWNSGGRQLRPRDGIFTHQKWSNCAEGETAIQNNSKLTSLSRKQRKDGWHLGEKVWDSTTTVIKVIKENTTHSFFNKPNTVCYFSFRKRIQ